jgi:hypothetical protein
MKTLLTLTISLFFLASTISSKTKLANNDSINYGNPIFSYKYEDCDELAIRTYDNLIHSEVDLTSAFAAANEIWFACMLDQN